MTVRSAKSSILSHVERALDDNEDYIGTAVWRKLEEAYEAADDEAAEQWKELEKANDRIEELEARIAELEAEQ